MGEINNIWRFLKQINGENANFITVSPKFIRDTNRNSKGRLYLMVYCVTNDDNVYEFSFSDGKLIGDINDDFNPKIKSLNDLNQKNVIDIKCGLNFMLALTKCGHVYSCGWNQRSQLGHQNTDEYPLPTIISSLNDKHVVDVSCGAIHSLALTRNGEVFEWGSNLVSYENITVPVQVIALQYQTIIAIACGLFHSLVLTENGDVYSWGKNNSGQLGIGNNINQRNPNKIDKLNGDKIVKICCGDYHSMLLSENGEIYMFGANYCRQLGDESNLNSNIPIKLNICTKFADIATVGFSINQFSIGVSVDGFCYVWGQCDAKRFNKPTKTEFKSVEDLLINYSKLKVTYKPYYFKETYEDMSPLERIKDTFNKKDHPLNNITFKIDGKDIYVQKQYLINVCEHINRLFSNKWLETTNNVIEITQYSYPVYYAFLKYLYTYPVEINSKDLIDLFYLSDCYLEENLKKICLKNMKEVINVNNVINFYTFAINNHLDELEKYLYDYMKSRFIIITKSDAYNHLKDSLVFKKLFEASLNN